MGKQVWLEEGEIFAEAQGPYAPEQLSDTATDDVFSRRFTNGTERVTVYAAPVIIEDGPEGFDVLWCTEYGPADGEPEGYEWDYVNESVLTHEQARDLAREVITGFKPDYAF